MPTVDLKPRSHCIEWKIPEDELKHGRELELQNMLNFDAFELVEDLPAYDIVWVDEWRGDRVRSRLCVRQFKAEGLRDDLFAGTPDTFFIKYLLAKQRVARTLESLSSIFLLHSCMLEQVRKFT